MRVSAQITCQNARGSRVEAAAIRASRRSESSSRRRNSSPYMDCCCAFAGLIARTARARSV